jgi:hypothetical protein
MKERPTAEGQAGVAPPPENPTRPRSGVPMPRKSRSVGQGRCGGARVVSPRSGVLPIVLLRFLSKGWMSQE